MSHAGLEKLWDLPEQDFFRSYALQLQNHVSKYRWNCSHVRERNRESAKQNKSLRQHLAVSTCMRQLSALRRCVNCAAGDTMHQPHPTASGLVHCGVLRQTTDVAAALTPQHTLQITNTFTAIVHNFAKCLKIFKTLSLWQSAVNL